MEHSQVVTYFEEYLKRYTVYKNSKMYNALIDYLKDNFTKNIYEDIPSTLKNLYEDNTVDVKIHDRLLQGLGVPKKVISKLSSNDKMLFFNNLSDFYRIRGDIDFFSKVSALFLYSTFDVYELYIDYDEVDDEWYFIPYLIIQNIEGGEKPGKILYNHVYNEIPSLLINKAQLEHYRINNEIILPIKSNIVLLNYLFSYEANSLLSLIVATFVNQYKDIPIDIYFTDSVFTLTLKTFYITWFYILLKNYNTSHLGEIPLQWLVEYSSSMTPYDLDNMDELLAEYSEIKNAREAREFYTSHIENVFKTLTRPIKYTHESLEPYIDHSFVTYINDRVSQATGTNDVVYNDILNELLNSFILHTSMSTDAMFNKYSEYFINSLTRIRLDPKSTSSYVLLNNFKPFHTELLTQHKDIIFSDNKFDVTTPDDESYRFLIEMQKADTFDIQDYNFSNFVFQNFQNQQMIEHIKNQIKYKDKDLNILTVDHLHNVLLNNKNIKNIIDYFEGGTNIKSYDNIFTLLDGIKQWYELKLNDQINRTHEFKTDMLSKYEDVRDIIDYVNDSLSGSSYEDVFVLLDDIGRLFKIRSIQTINKLDDFEHEMKTIYGDIKNTIDFFNQVLTGDSYEDLFIVLDNIDQLYYLRPIDEINKTTTYKSSLLSKYQNIKNIFEYDYSKLTQTSNETNQLSIDSLSIKKTSNQISGLSIIPKTFQFSRIYSWVRPRHGNLQDITGLIVGDHIYNYSDGREFAVQIIGFDYINNLILLDGIYQGPSLVGRLVRSDAVHESVLLKTTKKWSSLNKHTDRALKSQTRNNYDIMSIMDTFDIIET